MAPGPWTQKAVADALEDVARTLRRRPPVRVRGYVRPPVVRDEIIRQAMVNEATRLYGRGSSHNGQAQEQDVGACRHRADL